MKKQSVGQQNLRTLYCAILYKNVFPGVAIRTMRPLRDGQ